MLARKWDVLVLNTVMLLSALIAPSLSVRSVSAGTPAITGEDCASGFGSFVSTSHPFGSCAAAQIESDGVSCYYPPSRPVSGAINPNVVLTSAVESQTFSSNQQNCAPLISSEVQASATADAYDSILTSRIGGTEGGFAFSSGISWDSMSVSGSCPRSPNDPTNLAPCINISWNLTGSSKTANDTTTTSSDANLLYNVYVYYSFNLDGPFANQFFQANSPPQGSAPSNLTFSPSGSFLFPVKITSGTEISWLQVISVSGYGKFSSVDAATLAVTNLSACGAGQTANCVTFGPLASPPPPGPPPSSCGRTLSECTYNGQRYLCIFGEPGQLVSDCKVEETDYTNSSNGFGSDLQTFKGLNWAGPGEVASVAACAAMGGITNPLSCSPLDLGFISGAYGITGCTLVTGATTTLTPYLLALGLDPLTISSSLCGGANVPITGAALLAAPDSGIMLTILGALPTAAGLVGGPPAVAPALALAAVFEYVACGYAFTTYLVAPFSCGGAEIISTFMGHSLFQTQFIPGGVLPYPGTIGWTLPICRGGIDNPAIVYPTSPDCLPEGSTLQPGSAGDDNANGAIKCAIGRVVDMGITWDGDAHTDLAPVSGVDTPSAVMNDPSLGPLVNVNNTNGGGGALMKPGSVNSSTVDIVTPDFKFLGATTFQGGMAPSPGMYVEVPLADRAKFDLGDVRGGQILQVCGHWVTDTNRDEAWNELHPVTSLTILPTTVTSVTIPGTTSTVTTDGLGNTIITLTGSSSVVGGVVFPPGTTFSTSSLTGTYTTSGANTLLQVSGANVTYPPGKTITILNRVGVTSICIVDSPQASTLQTAVCGAKNLSNSETVLSCDGSPHTYGPFPISPVTRTYTCSPLTRNGLNFLQVGGLAYSTVIIDGTPPTLILPSDITTYLTGVSGASVTFSVSAKDDLDPNPVVACSAQSGSMFPQGITRVNCTATDASGNTARGSFQVSVLSRQQPVPSKPSIFGLDPTIFYAIIGAVMAVAVVFAAVALVHRRQSRITL